MNSGGATFRAGCDRSDPIDQSTRFPLIAASVARLMDLYYRPLRFGLTTYICRRSGLLFDMNSYVSVFMDHLKPAQ